MRPITTEFQARRRARREARVFGCPYAVWRSDHEPFSYLVLPTHQPLDREHWEVRFIAQPKSLTERVLLEVGAALVLLAFIVATVLA